MRLEKLQKLNYLKVFILRCMLETQSATLKDISPNLQKFLEQYYPGKIVSKRYTYRCISELVEDGFLIVKAKDAINVWAVNPKIKSILFSYVMAFFGLLETDDSELSE